MAHRRRLVAILSVAVAAGVAAAAGARGQPTKTTGQATVVAELFTSEGCSSCPPADDLLRDLVERQPIPGVQVLALGSHVDYWDRLGWRDSFSSPVFSNRQSEYDARVFRTDRSYTPQLVVDGQAEVIGSDTAQVKQALRQAAKRPKAEVTVTATRHGDRQARVDVKVAVPANVPPYRTADIVVAVTEDGLVSHVKRGENGGRTLAHAAVVRSLTTIGRLDADTRTASATAELTLAPDWQVDGLRIVALVQEQANRRIFGAGAATIGLER